MNLNTEQIKDKLKTLNGRFYVYGLYTDKEAKYPFYIGKGLGTRLFHHWHSRKSCKKNKHKRSILLKLDEVYYKIFYNTINEDKAYDYEEKLISKYGIKTRYNLDGKLCNISIGKRGYTTTTPQSAIFDLQSIGNYDKFVYHNIDKVNGYRFELDISCKKCYNRFTRRLENQLAGQGCPKCSRKLASISQTKTPEQFKQEAKEVWGSLYNFDNTVYMNAKELISFQCPIHGEQRRIPRQFLAGKGCPKCGKIIAGKKGHKVGAKHFNYHSIIDEIS